MSVEAGKGFVPPSIDEFNPEPLVRFSVAGVDFSITRMTLISWIAIVAIIAVMVAAVRRPKLVPGRLQWLGESAYGFIRDGVAREVIGTEGLRFAPYLATLFLFIAGNNIMGIIPLAQISPLAKIAMPAVLAAITYVLYLWVCIREKGARRYFSEMMFIPGVPKPLYGLITPIELLHHLVIRPFTLAIRLFANLFAGHMLLGIFTVGTTYLLTVGNFSTAFTPAVFAIALVMTLFEFLVGLLQAYVFTILTAVYVGDAYLEH